MQQKYGTLPNRNDFLQLSSDRESFASVRSCTLDVDVRVVKQLKDLIMQSTNYDQIQVIERANMGQDDVKYINYDTLEQALSQFIQIRPSDDQLLTDPDYIMDRKRVINDNLKNELKRIENLIPQEQGSINYYNYKQSQGKKLIRHFKTLFPSFSKQIDELPESYLAPFLEIYKQVIEQIKGQIMDQGEKNYITSSIFNEKEVKQLGASPRIGRMTQSAVDEKIILDQKRSELHKLDLLVLKIVIALERVNYYTMGVILPRDQNLAIIPLIDTKQDKVYDIQSCLIIQTLIKSQISRLEQIERQLTPGVEIIRRGGTITNVQKSSYFTKTAADLKNKHEFREKDLTDISFGQRCIDIWHEFSGDNRTAIKLSSLKVSLHVKILQIDQQWESQGFRITFQLFYQPQKPHCYQTQVTQENSAWLFTEIPFAEHLLKSDLVMLIKVFKVVTIKPQQLKSRQKVNPKSSEPVQYIFLKAYSIVNLSDKFFQDKMKDGKPLMPTEQIKFMSTDQKYIIDTDYDRIIKEQRDNEFQSRVDEELSQKLNLHLQYTFISSINRFQLALRLDQSLVVRQKYYWQNMVKYSEFTNKKQFKEKDPQYLFSREIEQLNLKTLQRSETQNDLRISLNTLTIDKSRIGTNLLYRVQVFLVFNDNSVSRSSSNLRFQEMIYMSGFEAKKYDESHQTPIASVKKQVVNFRSEFNLRVPITLKTKDLANYKLVYMVYIASDVEKKENKISEMMVEENPLQYIFVPAFFAKQPLIDKRTGLIIGDDKHKEIQIQLMKFNPSKYLQEQLDQEHELIQGTFLTLQMKLNSQQYSAKPLINQLIEPQLEQTQIDIINVISQLSDNDMLIYHTKIMYSLLHLYNSAQPETQKEVFNAIIMVFQKFQQKQLLPYKSLISDYSEKWKGDRESDKKLLFKFIALLEQFPQQIQAVFAQPLDVQVHGQVKDLEQKLTHLPALLTMICRLFTREFQHQYAQIREKVNIHFNKKKWLERDLCTYRPDLVEIGALSKNQVCSKPQNIVEKLVESVVILSKNIQSSTEVIQEYDQESDDGADSLFQNNESDFVAKVSQYQTRRSSAIQDTKVIDLQLNQLKRAVKEIQTFQIDFCKTIRTVLINISSSLHRDSELQYDDPDYNSKVVRILDLQKEIEQLQFIDDTKRKYETKEQREQKQNEIAVKKKELEQLVPQVSLPFQQSVKEFPAKANSRLAEFISRRKNLRTIFWRTLQSNLNAVMNFIDRRFVIQLFDDKLLLKKIDPVLDKIVETIIPKFELCTKTYGAFYKQQLEHTSNNATINMDQIRNQFESEVKEATSKSKELREIEEKEIDKQIVTKVLVLIEILASDCFNLLPSDLTDSQFESEPIQELIATRISVSVYNHLKQYKNQFKEQENHKLIEKIKDTTATELQYLFFYKMSVFEKKYYQVQQQMLRDETEIKHSQLSMLVQLPKVSDQIQNQNGLQQNYNASYRQVEEFDNFDQELLNGLASKNEVAKQSTDIFEESKELTQLQVVRRSSFQKLHSDQIIMQQLNANQVLVQSTDHVILNKEKELQIGLGAQKEQYNFKDRQEEFYKQLDDGSDKRLCLFLSEMEDALSKHVELKEGSQHLSIGELSHMKAKYISLFQVLAMQHLSNLSKTAFQVMYTKRPGCLDRLVRQVRLVIAGFEFGDDELFLSVRKLQVIEQFCRNVIDALCEPMQKKYIADLQDRYTYRSIISQLWVLQLILQTEQAKVLYEYEVLGRVFQNPDKEHYQNVKDFNQKLVEYSKTQNMLLNNYKDMNDMILPMQSVDIYTNIQGRIQNILLVDLKDNNIEHIDSYKMKAVLEPLASMYVQLDQLTYKNHGKLSFREFKNMEIFINKFAFFTQPTNKNAERVHQIQKLKKRQICEQFCEKYANAIESIDSKDVKFKQEIKVRLNEILLIKKLYLQVIEYEKVKFKESNLLAQLIAYFELMQILQDKALSDSFQSHIKVKYQAMIQHINDALYQAYQEDYKKSQEDEDHICQKQASQYVDQMKEVKAFMHVEDYYSHKSALEQGLMNELGSIHYVKTLGVIIDQAVALLVPGDKQIQNPNQFFDVALKLLSDKRALQEQNYDYVSVIQTLKDQTEQYCKYETFEQKSVYCNYYRIKIEAFLPVEMQQKDRIFIYRTPSGYNQEFIKHDLGILLNQSNLLYSKECDVKPLQPLTSEVRKKYHIPPNTENLSDTPDEVNKVCPQKFRSYYRQNFKNQFYVEQCPSSDPAAFDEEYIITIYEVKKQFPTMTMIQQVNRIYEKKVPRVKIELWTVQAILEEIQLVLRKGNVTQAERTNQAGASKGGEAQTLDDLLQKYVTNDDVGGGLPKMLDIFFNESLAVAFKELKNDELRRGYLDLFKGLEAWMNELNKVVEMFSTVGRNAELTKLAEERLQDRGKVLLERKYAYKLNELQENF